MSSSPLMQRLWAGPHRHLVTEHTRYAGSVLGPEGALMSTPIGSLPSSEGIRGTVKNKTVSDIERGPRGPRRRLAGLIGADPHCEVRRALGHKSVVR